MNPFSNPELLRNARIQLRPGRAVAAAIISAAVSLTIWYSFEPRPAMPLGGMMGMFQFILRLQIIVLLIGGGIYELLSVHREKELNTFDYQRVTRLTSLELAVGKLFGAPVLMYFIVACLMPIALLAVIAGRLSPLHVVEAYAILFVGCVTYHALALLISMALGRGASAIAILPFLLLVAFTSADYAQNNLSNWVFHQLNPFAATAMFENGAQESWKDIFFGISVPHFIALLVVYLTFIAWFLLALRRNLKRDPMIYELYSPLQAFGFALYLNLLLIGFFNWKSPIGVPTISNNRLMGYGTLPPLYIEQMLLLSSFWIFVLLGVVLLRNREQVRRRIQVLGKRGANLWAALWPAPYLFAGIIVAGVAIVELIRVHRRPAAEEWNWELAIANIAFIALWLARDLLYLQWMNLRRTRRPLVSAVLYLIVFYVCANVILSVIHISNRPAGASFTAMLIPSAASSLGMADWAYHQQLWLIALAVLGAEALLFALLQWQKLRGFIRPAVSGPGTTAGSAVVQPTNSVLHL